MISTDLKELMNDALKNAKFIIKKTKCRQALNNYIAIKYMRDLVQLEDDANDELMRIATEAAETIKNYKKLAHITQETVGETTWQNILAKTYKQQESECK